MIRVDDLSIYFGHGADAFAAARDISFFVQSGESFGLVGESGSGKTTVLRALAGLLDGVARVSGEMVVAGEHLQRRRSKTFRRQVQMVFQDPYGSLHPRHTVDQILSEPARIHRMDDIQGRVLTALEEVGLDRSFRFRFPHQISGGQRQRVAVARALITQPSIILLDEPTSALDVSVQAEVLNLLVRLRKERGLTYILVSHNLAVVSHMCNRLAVMQQGRILETLEVERLQAGTPAQAYTRTLLLASKGYDRAAAESVDVP